MSDKEKPTLDKAAAVQPLSDSEVEAMVKELALKILGQQDGAKTWGVSEHIQLVYRIAVELGLPASEKTSFKKALAFKGVGGNAAQFRQWDVLNLLSKKEKLAKEYAD